MDNNTISLVGGGQVPHSFDDLCHEFLLQHWPDWNQTEIVPDNEDQIETKQKSFLIPPICQFKNPHFANIDIQLAKESTEKQRSDHRSKDSPRGRGSPASSRSSTGSPQPLTQGVKELDTKPKETKKSKAVSLNGNPPGSSDRIERQADEAEYMVYKAVSQLVQDNQHQFLAIHSLNLDCLKVDSFRKTIFAGQPDPNSKIYREYDFVLIGPKIGIVCIEVKSIEFRVSIDEGLGGMSNDEKTLKRVTTKAAEQLNYFEDAVRFLTSKYCPELSGSINVEKIVCMPNADNPSGQESLGPVESDGIRHWFSNERANSSSASSKPELYTTLKELLDQLERNSATDDSTTKLFEHLAPPLLGLASLVKIPTQQNLFDSKRLLGGASCDQMDATLASQGHLLRKSKELTADAIEHLKGRGQLAGNACKYVLLNLEQQKALKGGQRQFLLGAAGTGKTIILQEKISRLLKEGKNVLVYAPENFTSSYESLRVQEGTGLYQVKQLKEFDTINFYHLRDYPLDITPPDQSIFDQIDGIKVTCPIHDDIDAIIIDDSLDLDHIEDNRQALQYRRRALIGAIWTMLRAPPSTLVWMALDQFVGLRHDNPASYQIVLQALLGGAEEGRGYAVSKLRRVMRCSGNVFDVAYDKWVKWNMYVGFEAILGHRIQGPECRLIKSNISDQQSTFPKDIAAVWPSVHQCLVELRNDGHQWKSIAVICGHASYQNAENVFTEEATKVGIPIRSSTSTSNEGLTIAKWNEVSSREWPVVVYVTLLGFVSMLHVDWHGYQRYRTCSRATNRVIVIEC